MFLMYFQECHYCQSDLVVIEFTGRGPCTRRLLKSSAKASDFGKSSSARALASKFYYHQVLLTVMYHCLDPSKQPQALANLCMLASQIPNAKMALATQQMASVIFQGPDNCI